MIASGSIHAVVNGIVKGGRDKMASRAVTDGASAIIMLPAIVLRRYRQVHGNGSG